LIPKVTSLPEFEMIQPWLLKDKKKSGGRIGFSLPDSIGTCRWDVAVNDSIIVESFDWLKAQVKSVPFRLSVDQ
jgi:3-dehydroquinate synthetase